MKPAVALLLIGSMVLAGCQAKVVTRSEIRRLRPGMTYEQTVDTIGAPGRLRQPGEHVVGALIPSPGLQVYTWTNPDGSLASAAFSEGLLTGFSEHGL